MALRVLMGALGLLMLLVCANVANLVLVRAQARQQEFAIRAALGAGWGRIAWEQLAESLTLGLMGGALGLGLAYFGVRLLVAIGPAGLPRLHEITLGPAVVAFALLCALGTSLLFGTGGRCRASRATPHRERPRSHSSTGTTPRATRPGCWPGRHGLGAAGGVGAHGPDAARDSERQAWLHPTGPDPDGPHLAPPGSGSRTRTGDSIAERHAGQTRGNTRRRRSGLRQRAASGEQPQWRGRRGRRRDGAGPDAAEPGVSARLAGVVRGAGLPPARWPRLHLGRCVRSTPARHRLGEHGARKLG